MTAASVVSPIADAAADPAAALAAVDVGPEAIAALVSAGAQAVSSTLAADAPPRHLPDAVAHELLVGVTHDLRSPLGAILLLVEGLRKGQAGPLTAAQERQLGIIYSAAFGLAGLTNDALDLARGGVSLQTVAPAPMRIDALLASVRAVVQPVAEEKHLALRISAPPLGQRLGRSGLAQRVLLNLVTNALKCTAHGGVTLSAQPVDEVSIAFEVRDTGGGLPPQLEAGFQGGSSEGGAAGGSAGVGLALCRHLLASEGSRLTYERAAPHGACFRFTLALPPVG